SRNCVKHQPNTFCRVSAEIAHDFGAGDESRTRDLNVGNVALYQLSYSRVATRIIASVDLEISLIRSASELGVTSTSRLRHPGAGKAATFRRYHWHHGSEGDDHPPARG